MHWDRLNALGQGRVLLPLRRRPGVAWCCRCVFGAVSGMPRRGTCLSLAQGLWCRYACTLPERQGLCDVIPSACVGGLASLSRPSYSSARTLRADPCLRLRVDDHAVEVQNKHIRRVTRARPLWGATKRRDAAPVTLLQHKRRVSSAAPVLFLTVTARVRSSTEPAWAALRTCRGSAPTGAPCAEPVSAAWAPWRCR